jgi:hypothetical protein
MKLIAFFVLNNKSQIGLSNLALFLGKTRVSLKLQILVSAFYTAYLAKWDSLNSKPKLLLLK